MEGNQVSLDAKEAVTLAMYNQTAEKWAMTSDGTGTDGKYLWSEAMRMLSTLAARAPSEDGEKQTILEIGFGTGRDALLLAPHYNYIGVDPSEGFLQVAQRKTVGLSNTALLLMTVYDLRNNFPPGSFDLFWSCATLLHCSRNRMWEALDSIRDVMKDGAIGFISLKEGDGEELDHYDGLPRYFTYWRHEEFVAELREAGFKIIEAYKKVARINFLCYFVQKV